MFTLIFQPYTFCLLFPIFNSVDPYSVLNSVAEPEPVRAGTFWSEPEPVWRCEGKNIFFNSYLAYF